MRAITPSATLSINTLVQQKKRAGELVYNFSAGDPALKSHPACMREAHAEIDTAICPYPPVLGLPDLRSACAEWMNEQYHSTYSPNNVVVTDGGKFGIFATCLALLSPGDEVLIHAPYWVSYPSIVEIAGGVPKIIVSHEQEGWKLNPQTLKASISPRTKMVILNNACNPTGVVYTREEIAAILDAASGSIVLSDEVYSNLVYDGGTFVSSGSFGQKTVVVQSMSKNFGMSGWRVGFVLAPEPIIDLVATVQGQSTSGVSLVNQRAALGALKQSDEVSSYVKEAMVRRREVFMSTFHKLFFPMKTPQSSLYAFVSLRELGVHMSSVQFCERVLRSHNVALVPGVAFGVEGYVRCAFSEEEHTLVDGLHALKRAVEEEKR